VALREECCGILGKGGRRESFFERARGLSYLPRMRAFFLRWIVTTLAVGAAVELTGMRTEGLFPLITVSLFLGILNALVRPVLLLLSLPFILVTMGMFILVVNGLLLWIVGSLVPGFHVDGFWQAFFGAVVVSLVSWLLNGIFRSHDGQYRMVRNEPQPKPGEPKPVNGRVLN
jgi:putative membrane protein